MKNTFVSLPTTELATADGSLMIHELASAAEQSHTFLSSDALIRNVCRKHGISASDAEYALDEALRFDEAVAEGCRIYLPHLKDAEDRVAAFVADALARRELPPNVTPLKRTDGLSPQQYHAVLRALSSRLYMITGGAGTGKSTLIKAIADNVPDDSNYLLCAPTGKAAQNLAAKTGAPVCTVHSALGVPPNGDFTNPRPLSHVDVLIVDEASMLSVDMMCGIVSAVRADCRVILVGDCAQLQPIGPGNVLAELISLGVPHTRLSTIYRQSEQNSALYHNMAHFDRIRHFGELRFDNSFDLLPVSDSQLVGMTAELFCNVYRANPSAVVLTPFHKEGDICSRSINRSVQALLFRQAPVIAGNGIWQFYEGDRVLFTRNHPYGQYVNGDIGYIREAQYQSIDPLWAVDLMDGGTVIIRSDDLGDLDLAYAMTDYKAQGSAFDVALIPMDRRHRWVFTRNHLYTSITRARRSVLTIGDVHVLDYALWHAPPPRNSALCEKVTAALSYAAS